MSSKAVIFDNGYRCYTESNIIADSKDAIIADLHGVVNGLSLKLNELSNEQIWALCKPIINAYEKGVKQSQKCIKRKFLQALDLWDEEDTQ